MSIEPFLIALFASLFVVVAVTILFYRDRSVPGVEPLLVASVAELWWLLCYAGELFSPTTAGTEVFARLEWASAVFIPMLWAIFVVEYTGRGQYITRNRLAALAVPPAIALVAVATAFESLVRPNLVVRETGGLHVVIGDFGPIYWLFAIYAWLLVVSSLLLLVEFVIDSRDLYQKQAIALIGAGAVPQVASIVNTTKVVGLESFSLTPLSFALSSGLVALAILEFDAFSKAPVAHHLATDTALSAVEDPVFVVDRNQVVVDCNAAACSMLGLDREALTGTHRSSLAPLADVDPDRTTSTVTVERGGETTYYDVQTATIHGEGEHVFGTVVTLRDVTARRQRKQRLDTLNDVLRATIQEEMETLKRVVDDEDDVLADSEEIRDRAAMALDMSDRAGDLASMIDPDADSPADIVPIIHEEIDAAREWQPDVSFVLDATLDEWAYCSGLFEPVFRVSLRQAAKRSLAADAEPVVGVAVTSGPEAITVSVSDRGPSLTEHERAVLVDGAEPRPTDKDDMSRWLINWGVEQAGGTLRLGTDGDHTSFELTFPRTAESDRGQSPLS